MYVSVPEQETKIIAFTGVIKIFERKAPRRFSSFCVKLGLRTESDHVDFGLDQAEIL